MLAFKRPKVLIKLHMKNALHWGYFGMWKILINYLFFLFLFYSFSDNLELGNNKKAIQEADKVLKKSPSVQCARALKALALLRIGREDEAEPMMKILLEEKPCDVSTLQVMTFYYRETDERKLKRCTKKFLVTNFSFFSSTNLYVV